MTINPRYYGVPQFGVNLVPSFSYVSDISQERHAVVTFTAAHDFVLGEYVSLRVSKPYGMVEINNQRGLILELDSLSITIDIDSTFYTPFVYPVSGLVTPPVCVPVASGKIVGTSTVILNDAFDNEPL